MKQALTQQLTTFAKDRYLVTLTIGLFLFFVAFLVYTIITVQASDIRVVTHYTAFGITHFYRDQWFYLFSFPLLAGIIWLAHSALAIKLLDIKGRTTSLFVLWLGIALIAIAWITKLRLTDFL